MSLRLIKALFRPSKSKVTSEQKQASLIRSAEKKEKRFVTGLPAKDREEYDLYNHGHMQNHNYYSYYARYYFKNKLIDTNMIHRLRRGAKLLSIGTGSGHLEKTLLAFSIPAENIDVTDIEKHPHIENTPFKKFTFDIERDWPDFEKKYDYIIFPESLLFPLESRPHTYKQYDDAIVEIITKVCANLNSKGEIRISANTINNILVLMRWNQIFNNLKRNIKSKVPKLKFEINIDRKTVIIRRMD